MKKIYIAIIFVLLFFQSSAQFKAKYVFCELVGQVKMNNRLEIFVDFGDNESYAKKSLLLDENGKELEFISMVDALNFMGMHGWEFVQAYIVSSMNSNVYHFMLKKPFEELDTEVQKLYKW